MGGSTVMILLACTATVFSTGSGQNPADKVVDGLVDQLTERTLMLSPDMSVHSMQRMLKMCGVPPTPLQKLALTQYAATRNPSLRAQVMEEFSSVDDATQTELKTISKEIGVRAGWFGEGQPKYDLQVAKMAGMTAPLASNGKPFDPLGIAANVPAGKLYFYREAELKNGRVAMLAFLSIVLTDKLGVHPWFGNGEYVSAIQSHLNVDPYPRNFWMGLLVACGFAEFFTIDESRARAPGDLGWDPLGLKPKSDAEFMELQNKELNNGRLAMIAMAGIYAQELVGPFRGKVF
jgi:hypothetical protein